MRMARHGSRGPSPLWRRARGSNPLRHQRISCPAHASRIIYARCGDARGTSAIPYQSRALLRGEPWWLWGRNVAAGAGGASTSLAHLRGLSSAGRAAVSKTAGRGFDPSSPCHICPRVAKRPNARTASRRTGHGIPSPACHGRYGLNSQVRILPRGPCRVSPPHLMQENATCPIPRRCPC